MLKDGQGPTNEELECKEPMGDAHEVEEYEDEESMGDAP